MGTIPSQLQNSFAYCLNYAFPCLYNLSNNPNLEVPCWAFQSPFFTFFDLRNTSNGCTYPTRHIATPIQNQVSSTNNNTGTIIAVVSVVIILILASIILVVLFVRKRSKSKRNNDESKQNDLDVNELKPSTNDAVHLPSDTPTSISMQVQQTQENNITFISSVTVCEKIGSGHFGQVFKGNWKKTPVALKLLYEPDNETSKQKFSSIQNEFENEAKILSYLTHPNIILFLGIYNEDGKKYIVTEFADHGDLSTALKIRNITWPMKIKMIKQCASAMVYLGQKDIVHRYVLNSKFGAKLKTKMMKSQSIGTIVDSNE